MSSSPALGFLAGRQRRPFVPISAPEHARQIGVRFQRARLAKNLSQEAVAHAAGISTYTYQKFEKGKSKPGTPMNPRLTTVMALCNVLEMGIADLTELIAN